MNKAEAKKKLDEVSNMIQGTLAAATSLYKESSELQAIIDAPDVYEPPKHKHNWFIAVTGGVNESGLVDNKCRIHGNEWPTERLAKIASLRIKITNYLGHIQYELCPDFVPDFEDDDKCKYYPIIDTVSATVKDDPCWTHYLVSGVPFQTSGQAIEAGNRVKHLVDELNDLIGGK